MESSPTDVVYNATIIRNNSSITIIEDTTTNETIFFAPPTLSPTVDNDAAEETHQFDADAALLLNITLICCTMLAYYVKKNKCYFLPESAVAMLVGVVIGGIARLNVTDLTLFSFSPELFFFVLLPPIIFEAGYSLEKKGFFDNIGAIVSLIIINVMKSSLMQLSNLFLLSQCLYAFGGTIISAFAVGWLTFMFAQNGLIGHVDQDNAMEALLFGALISAVDPVATLSM
jgi:sodium/hydrogen exchanger 8